MRQLVVAVSIMAAIGVSLTSPVLAQTPLGTSFTYQGRLESAGQPAIGLHDLEFRLWDAAVGGSEVAPAWCVDGVDVAEGHFSVSVNFGNQFKGDGRWLAIAVRADTVAGNCSTGAYTPLAGRQALTAAPYALALPGLWTQYSGAVPNIIGGHRDNEVGFGVIGAMVSGGGSAALRNRVRDSFGVVGGGEGNSAGDGLGTTTDKSHATVGGGRENNASGFYGTIGGGVVNVASGASSTVGGGGGNQALAEDSTVGGGGGNLATAVRSTIGGGKDNDANGDSSTVAGGRENTAGNARSTVAGGFANTASGDTSVVGGGGANTAGGVDSVVAGGGGNQANGERSTIGGGRVNLVTAAYGTIAGGGPSDLGDTLGTNNRVTDDYGTIGGGGGNRAGDGAGSPADRAFATVAGGFRNTASGLTSTVGGGDDNRSTQNASTIAGGSGNESTGVYSSVGGGRLNRALQAQSTIAGGQQNAVDGTQGTIGGGNQNQANGFASTVAGGSVNRIFAISQYGTIGGGSANAAYGAYATIAGGSLNQVSSTSEHGTVGGGKQNAAVGNYSTVAGGESNEAEGPHLAIGGGFNNAAGGQPFATVAGGSSNLATGYAAAIPGGELNTAGGAFSFAAGRRAKTFHDGSFVWGDSQNADFASTAADQFLIRAAGGVGINTNTPIAPLYIFGTDVPAGSGPIGQNGLGLGAAGDLDYKWIQSYGGALALNPVGNNVGIGVSAPRYALDLGGRAFIRGETSGTGNGGGMWLSDSNTPDTESSYIGRGGSSQPLTGIYAGEWRLIVEDTGNVGIGTLAPTQLLSVNGDAGKPGGGAWSVFSDARLKQDITPLVGTLDKLLTLHGYEFEYVADAVREARGLPGRQIGLIAQEVQQVFPDWVAADAAGYLHVTERATTALLVEALRDLRAEKDAQITALRAEQERELTRRDARIADLFERLERIEKRLAAVSLE